MRCEKIISGGQTGVDRAALDAALARGIAAGGYCPQGRRAEDGVIHGRYPLEETASPDYAVRTARNVAESDATLVLTRGRLGGGTALTIEEARRQGKPFRHVRLDESEGRDAIPSLRGWLAENDVRVLNVAGPRASRERGIYEAARAFLERLLEGKE